MLRVAGHGIGLAVRVVYKESVKSRRDGGRDSQDHALWERAGTLPPLRVYGGSSWLILVPITAGQTEETNKHF